LLGPARAAPSHGPLCRPALRQAARSSSSANSAPSTRCGGQRPRPRSRVLIEPEQQTLRLAVVGDVDVASVECRAGAGVPLRRESTVLLLRYEIGDLCSKRIVLGLLPFNSRINWSINVLKLGIYAHLS